MTKDNNGPYSIGSTFWPGLSKLVEECGEVVQVVGKLLGTGGETKHWNVPDLKRALEEEIADVMAACSFVIEECQLDAGFVYTRYQMKKERFKEWHNGSKL
jgi:NTP pyrophosphatase (non-canonical NTP hydrolase)